VQKFKASKNFRAKGAALVSLFEANYLKCKQLFSKNILQENLKFYLPEGSYVNETIVEMKSLSNHTDLLTFNQVNLKTLGLMDLKMEVVIYHDAKMAEVTKINGKRQSWLSNSYPNPLMFSKDEKLQRNLFLSEWLDFIKKAGLANFRINLKRANLK